MPWKPDYITSEELKDYVRIPDEADDAEVATAITAASRAIDLAANRQFGQADTVQERYYRSQWHQPPALRGHWAVEIDDLMDDTDLLVDVDTAGDETYSTRITDYVLTERNAAADGKPWTGIRVREQLSALPPFFLLRHHNHVENVRVTAKFGWTAVPASIKQACLLQSSRLLSRRDSPYGVAGSPEAGNELRLLPKLDPDVALTVRSHYRWWGAR